MKNFLMFCLALTFMALFSVTAMADGKMDGGIFLYYSPATTDLDTQGITGVMKNFTNKDTYENDGNYFGASAYVHFGNKFGIDGSIISGTSEKIEPGADFSAWNPLTDEKVTVYDINATYTILNSKDAGMIDLLVGYLNLNADPGQVSVPDGNGGVIVMNNEPTDYYGLSIGAKYYYPIKPNMAIDAKINYVPSYSIDGHYASGENALEPEDIFRYRVGFNYYLNMNYGLTIGYQGITLKSKLKRDNSDSTVKNSGFYFGGSYNF